MNKKLIWGFGSLGLLIFFLILALAWMHGQIRGLDYQLQQNQKAIQELRDETFRLTNRLNDLIQIGHELRSMPLWDVPLRATLAIDQIIIDESHQHRNIELTAGLIASVIRIESAGGHRSISKADCYGLMQLLPTTAIPILTKMGFNVAYGDDIKELLFVPTVNVLCGIHELVRLRTLHLGQGIDSWHVTLMAYLYGPGVPGLAYSQKIIFQRETMRERGIT